MFYVHVSHDDLLQSFMLAHDSLLIDQTALENNKLQKKVTVLQERNDRLDKLLDRIDKLEKQAGIKI